MYVHVYYSDDDIGKPKAEVAASFINDRVAGCNVTPYPSHLLSLSFGVCFTAISCAIDHKSILP